MTSAIIVAAGSSSRMGFDKLTPLLGGRAVLAWSIEAFASCPSIDEIIIVAPEERLSRLGQINAFGKPLRSVRGGEYRHISVMNGLAVVDRHCQLVAVHDGARPLVTCADIIAVIERARKCGAAALAHRVVETLKHADENGRVNGHLDRSGVWAMETPQVFHRELLQQAYAGEFAQPPTDEVSAVMSHGAEVELVPSTNWNVKITHPRDLDLAERLIDQRS